MPTVAFIGAGSRAFATTLIGDVLSFDALADTTFRLMDIDEGRLAKTGEAATLLAEDCSGEPTIETTTDRRAALAGADYVINAVNVGGRDPFENEIRIPERYGVGQAIGDTLGPGGVFRGLRTIPTVLDIAAEMEAVCPEATLLNYTNPMAIVCWAVDEATDIEVLGLCHSVQGTVEDIGRYVGVPGEEIEHRVAGINHMAWVLDCEHDGEDLYPALREAGRKADIYEQDTVRFEMLEHFGAFPTESSHHVSEYLPYFRTDEATIEELTGERRAHRMPTATYLEGWTEKTRQHEDEPVADELTVERSEEYASRIIHSEETGEPRRLTLNVRNDGRTVDNLPANAVVEVPCLVDGTGVHPCDVGALPAALAALNRSNIAVQEQAVRAGIDGDRAAVSRAVKLDPLTGACLTLEEAEAMTEELVAANADYLPAFD